MQRLHDRWASHGRLVRRGFPIIGYIGANGHGKTMAMVHDTIPTLESGRRVLSTVRLLDYRNPRPCDNRMCREAGHPDHMAAHPLYERFTDYAQLLDAKNCDVLMDEVTGVASSRESQSMPVQVANFLVQLRRRNVRLAWSAPAWGRADLIIRECSQAVVMCTGFLPKRRPQVPGEPPRLWSDRRWFTLETFDAFMFEDFHARQTLTLEPVARQWFWRPGSLVDKAYDTLDPVSALGWAQESGMCMVCGGKRAVPRCSCEGHTDRPERPARRALRAGRGAPESASSRGAIGPQGSADTPTGDVAVLGVERSMRL